MRRRSSFLLSVGFFIIAGSALVLLLGWLLVKPAHQEVGNAPSWLNAENVQLSSNNGSIVHGWYHSPSEPQATVVLLHPVRGNRHSMLGRARFLAKENLAVLLIDFQAHGESRGEKITYGYLEANDAAAAVNYARSRNADIPIIVLGQSLGGAAALFADPPLDIDGLILESVYSKIEVALDNRLRSRFGHAATVLTPVLTALIEPALGIKPAQLAPIDHARHLQVPVLVVSGQADVKTTEIETEALFDSIRTDKLLWIVPGGTHQNLYAHVSSEYEQRIVNFVLKIVAETD